MKFIKNPKKVIDSLKIIENGGIITKTGCSVYVPESYRGRGLLTMGAEIVSIGYLAIVLDDGSYAVQTVPSFIRFRPSQVGQEEIDGVNYYVLKFQPNQNLVHSRELIKDSINLYALFEEILARGKIPWFYKSDDLYRFFDFHEEFCGISLLSSPAIGQMIIAQMTRSQKDLRIPHRELLKNKEDVEKIPYEFVGLRNVSLGASDTISRIIGSHSNDGLDASFVYPSEKVTQIETMLRL